MMSRQLHSPFVSRAWHGVFLSGFLIVAMYGGLTCSAVAGDLLRGGGFSAPRGGSSNPGSFSPPSAAMARKNATDLLARTSQALQSMRSLQASAQAIAAAKGNNVIPSFPVTDGVSPHGLYPTISGNYPSAGLPSGANTANLPLPSDWYGIKSFSQSRSGSQTDVTITQSKQTAILNWSSFNVGKNTLLDFNQSAGGVDTGKWIALNIIKSPSLAPSLILGSIKADGQVYVINQNGIVFGGASQVNVHTLVASSLPINSYLAGGLDAQNNFVAGRGIINNPDSQFLFSALAQPSGKNGAPAIAGVSGPLGDVVVETGAQLTAPSNADHVGGRIALIGPNVINNGDISTPDGQTILAAGLQVGFGSSSDATLRGLNTYVGAVTSSAYTGPSAGTATNNGLIETPEGDAMITGKVVQEMGDIASSTSVTLNGRIDLLADYNAATSIPGITPGVSYPPFLYSSTQGTGTVIVGQDSVNTILPEIDSLSTVVGTQLALASQVRVEGQAIHFSKGSSLFAPNANVSINAGSWLNSKGLGTFVYTNSATSHPEIYMDAGAIIDAAGSADVAASVAENIIAVQLRGAELADDPAQRFGVFRGRTVYLDVRQQGIYNGFAWIGTPLANAYGYAGLIQRNVGELTVDGGSVQIRSGGSVVMQQGAEVNVSGGYINYTGALVNTTKVISDGHVFDISQATPGMTYQGIYSSDFTVTHSKYGISQSYNSPLPFGAHWEDGYVYGGNGGAVTITAPQMSLRGELLGLTESGPRQRQLQAIPSSLDIAFTYDTIIGSQAFTNWSSPTVYIGGGAAQGAVGGFNLDANGNPIVLPSNIASTVVLSPELTSADGFNTFVLDDSAGKVIVASGVHWQDSSTNFTSPVAADNGKVLTSSISVLSSDTAVNGSITAAGGKVGFTVYDISPFQVTVLGQPDNIGLPQPPYDPAHGNFTLAAGSTIDTSGLLVDDRYGSQTALTQPVIYNGGSVSVAASNISLDAGSLVNVSGGAWYNTAGKLAFGTGGAITLASGRDPNFAGVIGGGLRMNGQLLGYSGARGGSLGLTAQLVRVGSAVAGGLLLDPSFFTQGGFNAYSVTGIGKSSVNGNVTVPGLEIEPGVTINAAAESYVIVPTGLAGSQLALAPMLLPQESRAPVQLTFAASSISDLRNGLKYRGDLVVGAGATIESDPGGTSGAAIALKGDTVSIFGSVIAPSGFITVAGDSSSAGIFANSGAASLTTVYLAPAAYLSTAGVVVPTANAYGFNTGHVLGGGSIVLQGNVAAETGSRLNVAGASAVLDLLPQYTNPSATSAATNTFAGSALAPAQVDSNSGTVAIFGGESFFFDGSIDGRAGGASAIGGSLILASGKFFGPNDIRTNASDITLQITQGGRTIPVAFHPAGKSGAGYSVVASPGGAALAGHGYFTANTFENSGMDALTLGGSILFKGPVTLSAAGELIVGTAGSLAAPDGSFFTVPYGGYITADSSVHLSAPYVALGLPFQGPIAPSFSQNKQSFISNPTSGPGKLTVEAKLIDIGFLSLNGIGNTSLIASHGDIRGDGTLDTAGNLLVQAAQIYPITETTFNIFSYGGTVTFRSSGSEQIPLSAGGSLNVYATSIAQDGVLVAPMGHITLGWDGTGTAPVDPFTGAGSSSGGKNAIGQVIDSVPIAQSVILGKGSITSVSAVDPRTGVALTIPYGVNNNGTTWIDPSGQDITAGGVPQKTITIAGRNITDAKGSVIDLSGGGDLLAYRFVSGTQGTRDLLGFTNTASASNNSFAILPGYDASFAPYGVYNTQSNNGNFLNYYSAAGSQSDYGYYNPALIGSGIGRQVYLAGGNGLAAGVYTLLPARYALLPGAYLITARGASSVPAVSTVQPDGSYVMSGYGIHGLDSAQTSAPLYTTYTVENSVVVNKSALYDQYTGNDFLSQGATRNNQSVPPLPKDAGHLIFNAIAQLQIAGSLLANTGPGGSGAIVDIATSNTQGITISGGNGASSSGGGLQLDASALNAFGAGSLLVGGIRSTTGNQSAVTVTTTSVDVNNSGAPLTGPDIILAATGSVTLEKGASIQGAGPASGASDITINGNGALLRVSSDPAATVTRTGVTPGNTALLAIGDNVSLSGGSVVLDSSQTTHLGAGVKLAAQSVSFDSGHILLNLDNAAPASGLVLSGALLQSLSSSVQALSLLSYQSIDIYGGGNVGALGKSGSPLLASLALHAGAINGYDGANVTFSAKNIQIDNKSNTTVAAAAGADAAALQFNANTVTLGAAVPGVTAYSAGVDQTNIGRFSTVTFNAPGGIIQAASGGLAVTGNLTTITPVLTTAKGVVGSLTAGGSISIQTPAKGAKAAVSGGSGGQLGIQGASVQVASLISARAGNVNIEATTGDLMLSTGASIDASGVAQQFFDATRYTGGGKVSLAADHGNVTIQANGATPVVNVSAPTGGGDAGTVAISAPGGALALDGNISGKAGSGGKGGSFTLDIGSQPDLKPVDDSLNTGGFTASRTFRVRTGDVAITGNAASSAFDVYADAGSIDLVGNIDAHGATGGSVTLVAANNVTIEAGAGINAIGTDYNSAGQGGAVTLETTGGTISIAGNIDLGVTNAPSGSGAYQDVTGTLYLRAPQLSPGTAGVTLNDIAPITGSVNNASNIIAEGYYTQASGGGIDALEAGAIANAASFMKNATSIASHIAGGSGLAIDVRPGEEIDNPTGDLVLNSDWDLSTFRFGPASTVTLANGRTVSIGTVPGILTLRAAGNIVFNGALSDGFGTEVAGAYPSDGNGVSGLWTAPLLPLFNDGKSQLSWSYNIAAGADFGAVNPLQVMPVTSQAIADRNTAGAGTGSVEVGQSTTGTPLATNAGDPADLLLPGNYQVIRTGAGFINVAAQTDVKLLNQFATIYTAGGQVAPGSGLNGGQFTVPSNLPYVAELSTNSQATPSSRTAQYSDHGGNLSIAAGFDIIHQYIDAGGSYQDDTELQLPTNWLDRRGALTPAGQFGAASTTWWIDFSNFYEGVGTLGGGNVTLAAGHDVKNVDAVAATNARMPQGAPDVSKLVELGGGDLLVQAGNDVNAGVYYVERGTGTLTAGNQVTTNALRSANYGLRVFGQSTLAADDQLPTTLFLGKGSFDVSARGDVVLGPVANPFLLPQSVGNTINDKSYFTTYAASDAVNVTSIGGSVTLREEATDQFTGGDNPLLLSWYENQSGISTPASDYQPWLQTFENDLTQFQVVTAILPPTIRVTAFSGSIDLQGNLNLYPSATGNLDFLAAGAINGLSPSGPFQTGADQWNYSHVDISDAFLASAFTIASPVSAAARQDTNVDFSIINLAFGASGSTKGNYAVLQTQEALHAQGAGGGPLHAGDQNPVHLYATGGNISGVTLFSPKEARVIASNDITDIGFYLQNTASSDVSVVSAGRDLVAFDPAASLRIAAQAGNNILGPIANASNPGDIQVAGPGTVEVLAGRNFILGSSKNNGDIGLGITTIGNTANPYLPFNGASIVAAAGLNTAAIGLSGAAALDFSTFITQVLQGPGGARYFADLQQTETGLHIGTVADLKKLPAEQQALAALDLFFIVLRDAGRDHNLAGSPAFGTYTAGQAAVAALFAQGPYTGDMDITGREIKTENGGDINILVPGGQLTLGTDLRNSAADLGILTDAGGNISIFTNNNVDIGATRIFTLRGGNEVIWSSAGNIAAGASSKTVQSAPPTRVLVDPQSANVQTDLAGLATGGGIGVLASVAGVAPGSVDLIAPTGFIDAGDAGIRATGNLNLAAVQVLNASNIQAGGASSGVPTVVAAAPNLAGLSAASSVNAATNNAATTQSNQTQQPPQTDQTPSIIDVQVLGYGGGDEG